MTHSSRTSRVVVVAAVGLVATRCLAACSSGTSGTPSAALASRSSSQASSIAKPLAGERWRSVAAALEQATSSNQFTGAVLIDDHGQVALSGAYGLADRAVATPNTLDTRFNIGSVGKTFTAVATAQLVEQGKLAFADPVRNYLTELATPDFDDITVEELLTHTSGLGDFMQGGYSDEAKAATTARALLPLVIRQPPQFTPGSRQSYSNSGYVMLGALIEAVTGQSYYDYVRQHVFAPAGMTRTDWLEPGSAGSARGYLEPSPSTADNTAVVPWGNPSGGAYSTVGDLDRFARALLEHRLLSAAMTNMVMTGNVPMEGDPTAKVGYGFVEGTLDGLRTVSHGGGAPGLEASLEMYPTLDIVAVVLANQDRAARPLEDAVRAAIGTR